MANINSLGETPRRELHVFYILDTSGSMAGTSIATLNSAMAETIRELGGLAKSNADAKLKIAVMEFNTSCRWITSSPEDMEDFIWEDLNAQGLTGIGEALRELDNKLSKDGFLKSSTGSLLPVLIFMSDGYPTDDYKAALENIRRNRWFKKATKIAFAIGEEADKVMLSEIVGNSEAVIQTEDLDLFSRLIRFASVTASMLASASRTSGQEADGAAVVKTALSQQGLSTDQYTPALKPGDYNAQDDEDNDDDYDDGEWDDVDDWD